MSNFSPKSRVLKIKICFKSLGNKWYQNLLENKLILKALKNLNLNITIRVLFLVLLSLNK